MDDYHKMPAHHGLRDLIGREILKGDGFGISGLSLLIALLNLFALLYWCKPGHRRIRL